MEHSNLNERVAGLAKTVDLAEDLPEVVSLISQQPSTSLTKFRIIVERLLKSVAQFEGVVVPPKAMVGDLLKALRDVLPAVSFAEMEYVNRVASSGGAHDGHTDPASARRVLDHLCCALEWYAYEYLPGGLKDNFDISLQAGEKLVAYVSSGGTCRCAIANMITRHYLKVGQVRPMSLALHGPTGHRITEDAARVLHEELGIEAAEHRTIRADNRYFRQAALVLAMDEKLLVQLPFGVSGRAFLFSQFYGAAGGVEDPFKGGLEAYRTCFHIIHPLIAQGVHRLTSWLSKAE